MRSEVRGRGAPYAPRPRGGWCPVRTVRTSWNSPLSEVPVVFRSPSTVAAGSSIGTGGGVDLYAIERVLSGGYPQPRLTKTEAHLAWTLLIDLGGELSDGDVGRILGVSDRSVGRWRHGRTRNEQQAEAGEGEPVDMGWAYRAACRRAGQKPDDWFPVSYNKAPRAALQVCWSECPVRRECLSAAMRAECGMTGDRRSQEGVRGGYTPSQRAEMQARLDAGAPSALEELAA